tara:strand:+ start:1676 stop:2161 length:486 start_codon:yes stop_codon:yes gene_type:complete
MVTLLKTADVLEILDLVKDPEIPVVSVRDMGIIRRVEYAGDRLKVVITPTYTGCPAMEVIERDISAMLKLHGLNDFDVETEISPAWTTDWITEAGRQKLREYGIAPPANRGKAALMGQEAVACPQCGSPDTVLVSEFGSTACKALFKCRDCLETFDYFKCV